MRKAFVRAIVGIACASFLNQVSALEKDGAFVGFEIGAGGVLKNIPEGALKTLNSADYGFGYGARLGYLYGFNINNAIRSYVSFGQVNANPIENEDDITGDPKKSFQDKLSTGYRLDANVDYIFNFLNTLDASSGLYLGGFVGYSGLANTFFHAQTSDKRAQNTSLTKIYHGFGWGLNAGLTSVVFRSHIVEFGFKLAFGGSSGSVQIPKQNNTSEFITRQEEFRNTFFGLSYGYFF
ncbi:MAG: hypothetical protein E7K04_01515 [Helicobacter sp.]|mgnify:CR=1 FL=1|nr:hypothetical protein [Helicobacter sp.]